VGKFDKWRLGYERVLEWLVIVLMVVLAAEVSLGILFRAIGRSLVWYDEVASILLAWLTFYGSALAALKRAHIGFPGLINSLKPVLRTPFVMLAEALIFAFFALFGWVGFTILDVLATDHLVSLSSVSVAWTQSVVPISAVLILIAQALNFPVVLAEARRGGAAKTSDLAEMTH
jgi:TRAP-type C4-dicarboxylate transport system permease small subunit